jgi:UDP-glucose 4-epimerase
MKVLVTGGAGFIGWHVVGKLLEEKMQVVVVDDLSTGLEENIHEEAKFIKMDICSDHLLDVLKSEKFDMVIHLAAQTMVPVSLEKPDYDSRLNILGTVNVLEACRKTGVKRVIFASTAAIYGKSNSLPILEKSETNPTSFYGLSKLTIEKYLELYSQIYGLDHVILRAANVYGERQGDGGEGGVVSIFIRNIYRGEELTVFGDGTQTRDFIYVGDVAEAYYQSLITNNVNAAYNISTQMETSLNELIDVLGQISGKPVQKLVAPVREGDIYRSVLCNKEAQEKLGCQFTTSLKEGLECMYAKSS